MRIPGLLVLVALFTVSSLHAATWHVDPTGPLPTIVAAIDSAASGDTLLLVPAVYAENPLVRDKDLTIRSSPGAPAILDAAPFAGGIDGDGGNGVRVVRSFVRLESIVIRNAVKAPTGAAILIFSGIVQLRDCRLENNPLGAIVVTAPVPGWLDVEDCEIVGNGLGLYGRGVTRVVRTRFEGNCRAFGMEGEVEMADVEVTRNGCGDEGEAAVFGAARGRLERVVVHDNRGWIPGMWLEQGPYEVIDCRVENNESVVSDLRLGGPAGIAVVRVSDLTLRDCVVLHNTARGGLDGAGGLYFDRSSGRAVGCRIEDNESEVDGGGARMIRGSDVELVGCTLIGNRSAGRGGGVYADNASVRMDSVVVAGNTATSVGGAMVAQRGTTVTIRNTTLASNAAQDGGGFFVLDAGVVLERSIIAYNTGAPTFVCVGTVVTSCTDVFGNTDDALCGEDLGGNLSVDPQFCDLDPELGRFDLHLRRGSPVADVEGCGRLGAQAVACEPTRTEPITWGRLKQLYRTPRTKP